MRQSCLCHKTGSCVATQQGLGSRRVLGRAGMGTGARRRGRWALGERAYGRRWACVGAQAGAAGSWVRGRSAQRQAERAAGWASGSSAQGARVTQATGGKRAGRHGVGAQGRAAGRTVRVGHGQPGRGLGAPGALAGPVGGSCSQFGF